MESIDDEIDLLLCCASTSPSQEKLQRIETLLCRELDWHRLVSTASSHMVIPLLYLNLKRAKQKHSLSIESGLVEEIYIINAARNLLYANEMCRVSEALKSNGIDCIPYKGPVLAHCAYNSLLLRQFTDIDILVKDGDVHVAREIILGLGFECITHTDDVEQHHRKMHDYVFTDGTTKLELQWRFAESDYSFPIDMAHVWKFSQTVRFNGIDVLQPAPDDMLLILCGHGTKHLWSCLQWVGDVAEFVRVYHDDINWEQLIKRSRELKGKRVLLLGLECARVLLDARLPELVVNEIKNDRSIRSTSNFICTRLFLDPERADSVKRIYHNGKRHLFYLKTREAQHLKLHHIKHFLRSPFSILKPNSNDFVFIKLPGPMSFLYVLVRPVRLAWEFWHFKRMREKATRDGTRNP